MKISKKILSYVLISSAIILSGCNKDISMSETLIPSPSKIIAYNNGTTKTLTSTDEEYENIVKLTNARVEKDKLSVATDGVEIDASVNTEKKNTIGIEFVYEKETLIDIKNSNGFIPIKFSKLFFKLSEDNGNSNEFFQYGDRDKYIDSSRGPLKKPKELLEVVNTIFK